MLNSYKSQLQSVETQRTQLQQDSNTLHSDLLTLKEKHQASERQYTEDFQAIQQRLDFAQEENVALKASIDRTRAELLKTKEHQTELSNQLQSKKSALTLLKRNKEQLTEQLQQALKSQEALQKTTVESQAALREQQRKMQDEQERSKDLQTNLEEAATELSSLRSNGSEMEQRLRTLKAEREHIKQQLQEKTIESESLRSCLQDQQQVNETLKKVEEQKHTTQLENEVLQSEVDHKKTELLNAHKYRQGLLDQLKDLQNAQVESQAALREQQRKMQDEQERSKDLQTNLEEAATELSSLRSNGSEMEQRLRTLKAEREHIKQQLQEKTIESESLRSCLQDQQQVNETLKKVEQQKHTTQLENEVLQSEVDHKKTELLNAHKDRQGLLDQLKDLQNVQVESQAALREQQREMQDEQERSQALQTNLDEVTSEFSTLQSKNSEMAQRLLTLETEQEHHVQKLHEMTDKQKIELNDRDRVNQKQQDQIQQLQSEYSELTEFNDYLKEHLAETELEFRSTKESLAEVENLLQQPDKESEAKVRDLQDQLEKKREECRLLKTELDSFESNFADNKVRLVQKLRAEALFIKEEYDKFFKGKEDPLSLEILELNSGCSLFSPLENQASTEFTHNEVETQQPYKKAASKLRDFTEVDTACKEVIESTEQIITRMDNRVKELQKELGRKEREKEELSKLYAKEANDRMQKSQTLYSLQHDVMHMRGPEDGIYTELNWLKTAKSRSHSFSDIHVFYKLQDWEQSLICHDLRLNFQKPIAPETTDPDSHWPLTVPINDASVLPDSSILDESSDVETKPNPDDAYVDDDNFPLLPDSSSNSCLSSPCRKIIPNSSSLPPDLRGLLPGEQEPPLVTLGRFVPPGWSKMSQF